jgi:predicted nucleic acid-binding protein
VLAHLRRKGRDVRRASLVNDVLIALTCRAIGATLFTANGRDFEAVRDVRELQLSVVSG